MTNPTTYKHPKMQRTIDGGGYSGALTVTAAVADLEALL
jgi:hypothetical protein